MASGATPTFPWVPVFLLATPAFGLAAASGFAGLDSPIGLALAGAGAVYLAAELLLVQPRLERRALLARGADAAALQFLQRALTLRSLDDVAAELGRAVTTAIGPTRSVLLAPDAEVGVRLLTASGDPPAEDIGDATPAFLWLADAAEPMRRAQIEELGAFEGAAATLQLMDAVGCDVLLPLRHRGLLLGLALIAEPAPQAGADTFYRAMRAYATVAMANTFLDAEARGRGGLAQSFDLATAMQESLMPDERPVRRRHYELRGIFQPVAECGGDLWAWRELADDRVLLVIADATGHGVAPALLAAVVKGAIDAHWQIGMKDLDPGQLLAGLNRAAYRTGRKRYMMTAFAAVVDVRRDELVYANAGHNFPYFVAAAEGRVEPLVARGNSLGASPEAEYETHRRPMRAGDKLVLYTDGITEAGAPAEEWGERRLRALLTNAISERATRLPDLVLAELERHLQGRKIADDVTMLAFERPPPDQEISS